MRKIISIFKHSAILTENLSKYRKQDNVQDLKLKIATLSLVDNEQVVVKSK